VRCRQTFARAMYDFVSSYFIKFFHRDIWDPHRQSAHACSAVQRRSGYCRGRLPSVLAGLGAACGCLSNISTCMKAAPWPFFSPLSSVVIICTSCSPHSRMPLQACKVKAGPAKTTVLKLTLRIRCFSQPLVRRYVP
jgi:hypothetical protein